MSIPRNAAADGRDRHAVATNVVLCADLRGPRLRLRALAVLLLSGAVTQTACVAPTGHQRSAGFIPPPREAAKNAATEKIKAAEILQLQLPGDSSAALNVTCEVAADGTIEVAGAGRIEVAGKTLDEAQQAIAKALGTMAAAERALELRRHEFYLVSVNVVGEQAALVRVPLKGKLSVRDVLLHKPGLRNKLVWIARPMSGATVQDKILPVDADSIASGEATSSNYYLQTGDFLFVADEPIQGVGRMLDAMVDMIEPTRPSPPAEIQTAK